MNTTAKLINTLANALVASTGNKHTYGKQALNRLGQYGQIF